MIFKHKFATGILPYAVWYHMNFIPKHDMNDPLPKSAQVRGAYHNTGSKDIGPDRSVPRTPYQEG